MTKHEDLKKEEQEKIKTPTAEAPSVDPVEAAAVDDAIGETMEEKKPDTLEFSDEESLKQWIESNSKPIILKEGQSVDSGTNLIIYLDSLNDGDAFLKGSRGKLGEVYFKKEGVIYKTKIIVNLEYKKEDIFNREKLCTLLSDTMGFKFAMLPTDILSKDGQADPRWVKSPLQQAADEDRKRNRERMEKKAN